MEPIKAIWRKCQPIWGFLRPIIFPEHHRKLARSAQLVGITLLLGTPFLQWLVQTVIVATVTSSFGLSAELLTEHLEGGQVLGFWLVMTSLAYSALIRWIDVWDYRSVRAEIKRDEENVLRLDRDLYREFLADFGTNGTLEELVCYHNFGNSWSSRKNTLLSNFVSKWSAPERTFQHPELASLFLPILSQMEALNWHLIQHAGPLRANGSLMGIFDPSIHNDFDTEDYISDAINEANMIGISIRDARVAFIRRAGEVFATLPL